MKTVRPHFSEAEFTAWILIAIFLAALLVFSYFFWKRISRDATFPGATMPHMVVDGTGGNRSGAILRSIEAMSDV